MEIQYKNDEINILVVDDNNRNIQIIGQILATQKYNVSFATGGIEALEIINSSNGFDLILLDILMPEMDGFEVCQTIKKAHKTKEIPIIFLTAKNDKYSIVKGLELGANDYVVKPFNEDELLLRVKTQIVLNKQREKLEQINQDLEERVNEKTAEIQLANKKLALLEKAKSDFLILISHELRTPLNIINGFTEVLHEALHHTEHKNDLELLKQSTDRLVSLSETALLITEIRLGKFELEFSKIDLSAICNRAVKHLKNVYSNSNFDFTIRTYNESQTITGDLSLIQNIVIKIIENAVIAKKENCKLIFNIVKANQAVILEIIDNGPGFSELDMQRLFEVFAKEGPDLNHDGFGLGLAAVKLVMEIHSGDVTIQNLPEGGAKVCLHFNN